MSKKKDQGDEVEYPWTAPTDSRYPNQNVSRYCYQMYIDYHRCSRLFGKGHEPCEYFHKAYKSLCPNVWVNKWNDQINEGTFPVDLPKENKQPPKK